MYAYIHACGCTWRKCNELSRWKYTVVLRAVKAVNKSRNSGASTIRCHDSAFSHSPQCHFKLMVLHVARLSLRISVYILWAQTGFIKMTDMSRFSHKHMEDEMLGHVYFWKWPFPSGKYALNGKTSERALAFVLEWEMNKIALLGLLVSSCEPDFYTICHLLKSTSLLLDNTKPQG